MIQLLKILTVYVKLQRPFFRSPRLYAGSKKVVKGHVMTGSNLKFPAITFECFLLHFYGKINNEDYT